MCWSQNDLLRPACPLKSITAMHSRANRHVARVEKTCSGHCGHCADTTAADGAVYAAQSGLLSAH